jgi:serine kinase of HPr protein (carbohydrate metabolism regulator)
MEEKMKKFLTAALAALTALSLTACSSGSANTSNETNEQTESDGVAVKAGKIGVILVGDENEGYTAAHMTGISEAAKKLGIADDQIIWKYNIGETQDCKDAAVDLVDSGATLVISNSYGHQSFMQEAAGEYQKAKKNKPRKLEPVEMDQMSLFDTVSDSDVLKELQEIDISNLTPIDALNTIYRLQNKLKNRWQSE